MGINKYTYYDTRTLTLTCGYKKYLYPLLADTNFFDIPNFYLYQYI